MPYDDIPTAGRHPGDDSEHESGSNVRAPGPPEPGRYVGKRGESADSPPSLFRLARHRTEGTYRVRAWTEQEMEALGDDYEEMEQYESADELSEGIREVSKKKQFVVFENLESGEVKMGRAAEVHDNWATDGHFDQFKLFDSEEAAARYAEKQQG